MIHRGRSAALCATMRGRSCLLILLQHLSPAFLRVCLALNTARSSVTRSHCSALERLCHRKRFRIACAHRLYLQYRIFHPSRQLCFKTDASKPESETCDHRDSASASRQRAQSLCSLMGAVILRLLVWLSAAKLRNPNNIENVVIVPPNRKPPVGNAHGRLLSERSVVAGRENFVYGGTLSIAALHYWDPDATAWLRCRS